MSPARHALLIGVDHYDANSLGYGHLNGAVRDIERVEAFLKRSLKLEEHEIQKLTAPHETSASTQLPTHKNISDAFTQLIEHCDQDDLVYVHYSGHGGRASTRLPEIKGAQALDEGLVPSDIGNSESNYLRDMELAHYCRELVKKGAILTVVLDCCHSGGMNRGQGSARRRGSNIPDTTLRPTQSYALPVEMLAQSVQRTRSTTRNTSFGAGWLPEPEGYTLLTACRSTEYAYEDAFEGNESQGILTYAWLQSLETSEAGTSYQGIFDRVLAEVLRRFAEQTPQLYGEGNRVIFDKQERVTTFSVPVLDYDADKRLVRLNAGQVQGIEAGAKFALFPKGTTDFKQLETRKTLATVKTVQASESLAEIDAGTQADKMPEPGDAAVLDSAPTLYLQQVVTLVEREDLPAALDQKAALSALEAGIQASSWLVLKPTDAALQVAINEAGQYEIWDSVGKLLPNIVPPIAIQDADAAKRLVARLEHLARYYGVKGLYNYDTQSKLAKAIDIRVVGVQHDYVRGSQPRPQPVTPVGNRYSIQDGDTFFVEVQNLTTSPLNLTVLALQADWSIEQAHPHDAAYSITLEANVPEKLTFTSYLPSHIDQGLDTLKFFITRNTTNFRWLSLPSLDEQPRSRSVERGPQNPLEQLLTVIGAEHPTRNVISVNSPSDDWTIGELEIFAQRSIATPPP